MFVFSDYSRKKFNLHSLEEIIEIIKKYNIDSAIVAFSGGMDSCLATYICRNLCKIKVSEAIFISHYWIWEYIKENIKSLADELDLKLHVIDISEELEKRILNAPGKNVCRICIRLKNEVIAKKAKELGYKYIITGHNGMDQIAFALLDYYRRGLVKSMEVAPFPPKYYKKYGVMYIRPLIRVSKKDIERLAKIFGIKYLRVYEPGDKPHIMIREGCTLQHIDNDVKITKDILIKVKEINEKVNLIAREYKVPMAVKYPSLKIEILASDPFLRKLLEEKVKDILK